MVVILSVCPRTLSFALRHRLCFRNDEWWCSLRRYLQSFLSATANAAGVGCACPHGFVASCAPSLCQLHADHRFDVHTICAAWLAVISQNDTQPIVEWDGSGLLNRELLCRLLFSFESVAVAGEAPLPAIQFRCGTTRRSQVVNEAVQRGSCHSAVANHKASLPSHYLLATNCRKTVQCHGHSVS